MATISSYAKIAVRLDITTPDGLGKSVELREGDFIHGLTYVDGGGNVLTLSGVVRVINTTNLSNKVAHTCPPDPYTYRTVRVDSLTIDHSDDCDSNITTVLVSNIVDFESVESDFMKKPVDASAGTAGIEEVLATVEEGQEVALKVGEYAGALNITKTCRIVGPYDVIQSPLNQLDPAIVETAGGAVLSEAITINAPGEKVELRGMTFSGKARIVVSNAKEVQIVNCRFVDIDGTGSSSNCVIYIPSPKPIKVVVSGCMFGFKGAKQCKNVVECQCKLHNGSEFSNNYVSDTSAYNNCFCFYDVEDGAVITVRNNFIENSHNAIRIGMGGHPKCTVVIEANKWPKTNPVGEYDGLVCIQPKNKATETFEDVVLRFSRNVGPDIVPAPQLYYTYLNPSYLTDLTDEQLPKVFIEGIADDPSKHVIRE